MSDKSLNIEALADLVKSEIIKAKIVKWDLFLLDESIYGLYFRKADPELRTDSHNLSYFIRVFEDQGPKKMGVGLVNLNAQTSHSIQKGIQQAQAIAKINSNPKHDLVSPGLKYPSPKTYDSEVWEDPNGFLDNKGDELGQQLREISGSEVTYGKFRVYKVQKMLINHNEFSKLKRSTDFCYEFSFKAEKDGKKAEYWPQGYLKSVAQLKFDEFIPEWSSRARDSLKAVKPPSDSIIDVIFPAPVVRTALLATLGYAATGKALFEKTTPLNLGKKVAVGEFSVLDDGLGEVEDLLNTSAWDSEGNPKRTTPIITDGIMTNYLFDTKFATLLNKESTGNAQRKPSTGGVMQIEMNNLIVKPGTQSLADIVEDTKKAIYVNDFSWLNPNPITGIFGAEIRHAYMIENGELGRPVKGGNLSGNIYDMLKNIMAISKETRVVMNAQVPYIKFKGLNLSTD